MADNEDWRRQRAEELKLHEANLFGTRPAREQQPVVDGVQIMRRPVEPPPVPSAIPVTPLSDMRSAEPEPHPVEADRRAGEPAQRPGAEPAARRKRPQAPLVSAIADAQSPAASVGKAGGSAPKSSGGRHPLLLGTGIAAALAGAGALGWILRAEIAPTPVASSMIVRRAPAVASARAVATPPPASIVSDSDARPAQPKAFVSAQAARSAGTPPRVAAIKPLAARSSPANQTAAGTTLPSSQEEVAIKRKRVTATTPDTVSRFANPAKAVALPGRDFSPSFNCRRAIAAVNRAICANPELSALDRQLSQSFYRATASVDLDRHKAIDRDQTDFLNERARCNSDDCVANVYRQRLDALRQAVPGE